jgi:hypothetical protein
MNDYYVYALLRPCGTPFYIGKGCGRRWEEHIHKVRRGRSHKDNIIAKIIDQGGTIIKVKWTEGLSDQDALFHERMIIASLGRFPNGPLVNKTEGGDGPALTPEIKAKMSAAGKGRKQSPEWIANKAAARRRNKVGWSDASKQKASISQKNRIRTSEELARMSEISKMRKTTPEWRAKLSIAAKRRWARFHGAIFEEDAA